ncbi:MAG TPA: polyphenol oxidase family protein [Gemmatimonadales bacterium]|jgi:YfiH family protein
MSVSMAPAPLVLEVPAGDASVPCLEVAEWATRFGLVAGITTRAGGFSLGLWNEEPSGQVMTRWRAFRNALAPRFPTVVLGHQVHGTELRWHESVPPGWLVLDGVDGHVTRQPGVLLTVTVADCVPIYLAAPESGLVALLHAGWRGIADGILEHAVTTIGTTARIHHRDIVMHCGVSICGNCYEVGSEVAERLNGRSDGTATHVDLRSILAARAATLGVGAVTISAYCTAHHHDRFFSHRASRGQDGRQVAYLGRSLA